MTNEDKEMGEAADWGVPENDAIWEDKDKTIKDDKEDKDKEEKDEDIEEDEDTDNRKRKGNPAAITTTTKSSKPPTTIIDRTKEAPFLIKVVVRVGSHKDPKETANATGDDLIYLHTWKDATLREITCLLSPSKPDLNDPEARLSFKAIFPDPAASSSSAPPTRRGGELPRDQRRLPPAPPSSSSNSAFKAKELGQFSNSSRRTMADESKTLEDVKFIVGDVLEIAIVKGFSIVGASTSTSVSASVANASVGGGTSNVADRLGPRRGSVTEDRRVSGGHEYSNGRSGGGGRFHPYGGGRDNGGRFQRDGHDHRENRGRRGGRW
ncbi:UNVERIFIED_CONTAM: hypothetical protein HDU68_009593 [Siphonaria sp. JEL0065]|nr:hypothetical protein HDU68_009593 [Siphonaria sp. JEL0065]